VLCVDCGFVRNAARSRSGLNARFALVDGGDMQSPPFDSVEAGQHLDEAITVLEDQYRAIRRWRRYLLAWAGDGAWPSAEHALELRRMASEELHDQSIDLARFFAAIDDLIETLD